MKSREERAILNRGRCIKEAGAVARKESTGFPAAQNTAAQKLRSRDAKFVPSNPGIRTARLPAPARSRSPSFPAPQRRNPGGPHHFQRGIVAVLQDHVVSGVETSWILRPTSFPAWKPRGFSGPRHFRHRIIVVLRDHVISGAESSWFCRTTSFPDRNSSGPDALLHENKDDMMKSGFCHV
jgi:hypothetical protein